ncbi:MAG: amidohydrolase [Methylocystaceae bacterium]
MFALSGGKVLKPDGTFNLADVVVEGESIIGVGIDIPPGVEIINAAGKYITPGLIDGHTHLGLEEEIYREEGDDVNETSDPVTPHLQASTGINPFDLAFADALRGGVTRALVVPGSANIIGGQGALVKMYAPAARQMIFADRWGVKAALGENPKRVYGRKEKAPITRMASAALLKENLSLAVELTGKKTELTHENYRLLPLLAVVKGETPLWLHVHRADDILTGLSIAQEFGIKLVIQHGTEAHLVAEELKEAQVPVILGPMLTNRAKVEMKEVSLTNAARLWDKGVRFCFMTDHPVIPVSLLAVQAALTVREGLPEEIALRALTGEAASILGISDQLGTIEAGKKADLVLWSGHPFDFRSKPEAVWIEGLRVGAAGCEKRRPGRI